MTTPARHANRCLQIPLHGTVVLHVAGADARSFLHSQFSTDLLHPDPHYSALTSYSDPRGRLLAIPRVLPLGDEAVGLVLDAGIAADVMQRLRKYALRAQVSFQLADADSASQWRSLGICGEGAAAALLDQLGVAAPAAQQGCARTAAGVVVVRMPDAEPRWALHGPAAAIAAISDALNAATESADETEWRRRDIEAGLPRIVAATSGRFVAQMVNLDRLAAIDFRKGCYPGQEVIARTRYLGRIKRRMFIIAAAGEAPAPGESVYREGGDQPCGEVVDAVAVADGCRALAVLRLEAADESLRLGSTTGPAGRAYQPPYGLAEED